MNCRDRVASDHKPPGFVAIGIFLFFGGSMAALAATTLLVPGTVLDRAWALNPTAHKQLSLLGGKVTFLFLPLSVGLVASGIGWFRRRLWGWKLAVGIIAVQVIGDSINFVKGDWIRGGIGVIIAGSLLLYLLSSPVKSAFYK